MSLSAGRLVYLTGKLNTIAYSFDNDINNQTKIETNKQKTNVIARPFERAASLGFDLLFLKNIDFNFKAIHMIPIAIGTKNYFCSAPIKVEASIEMALFSIFNFTPPSTVIINVVSPTSEILP